MTGRDQQNAWRQITADEFYRRAFASGLTPADARGLTFREWTLMEQAAQRTDRGEWRRTLAIVNTVIGIMGGDPITMDGLQEKAKPTSDREAWEAWKGRNMQWISSHLGKA